MLRSPLVLALCLLALVACSRSASEPTTTLAPETSPTTSTTTTLPPTTTTTTTPPPGSPSPLNGVPISDPALFGRRTVAVKVDNHINARPQSGIEQAEAVYELQVEGGISRFIALYHTVDSDFIGPMRSARPTDIGLVKPLGATFFTSGMQPWVRALYREEGIHLIEDVRPASFRIEERRAPHNLYADSNLVREEADRREYPDDPPPPLFTWGNLGAVTEPARTVTFAWSGSYQIVWRWDGTRYLRFTGTEPHNWVTPDLEAEEQLGADTLVVILGEQFTARPDGSGTAVPATETVGSGEALVFANGRVQRGAWSRETSEEVFDLSTAAGADLTVPPGHLWIIVFPDDRPLTWN